MVREHGHVYLLARVSPATLDSLATFETSREDMEDDLCDEPAETDESHDGKEPPEDDEPLVTGATRG